METAQTCACTCTTTDSALSIAANVISLVTLAYVVLVGIGYRVAIRQRSRTRSSNLYNDICTLQKKVESIQDSVRSKKVQGENDLDMILYMANHQLKSLINQFNVGYESDDKWYLIWKELQLARKREEWEKMLGTVKHQVDFYLNYRTLESLVDDRHEAEDAEVRDQRRALRTMVLVQAQNIADVKLEKRVVNFSV